MSMYWLGYFTGLVQGLGVGAAMACLFSKLR